jgi:hypothetical protein
VLGGGRAVDSDEFGEYVELVKFELGQSTAKIEELEKQLKEERAKEKALKEMDLENTPVLLMKAFLAGRKAHEIAVPQDDDDYDYDIDGEDW